MKLRIYKYSLYTESGHLTKRLISLLLLFCIGLPLIAQQQRPVHTPKRDQKKKEVTEIDTIPFYNGTYVGVDLYGIGSKLLGGDFMSSEVSIAVNLKNKFIPTVEFGMGGTDTWSETGIHYKSKAAPFFRIGVDYNTMAKKKEKNSYLYAGIRYAFSSFKYDVSTLPADDPIWGDNIGNPSLGDDYWGGSIPFNHPGMKASVQWLEIVLGVKVRIYKNFNMGWSVRMKYKTIASTGEYGDPWNIMTGLEIWLLAIGLAMDCFAVSIASGIILKHTQWRPMLVMAFAFGFFQALMPFIGWMFAKSFSHLIESVDHWIAFAILAFLGGRMIFESFKEEECCQLFNPTKLKVVFTMAIATSIDALAIGISFAFLGVQDYTQILSPICIIGLVSFVMSLIGLIFGIQCGCGIARKLKAELWGGIILVIIGLKILVEHLFFQ